MPHKVLFLFLLGAASLHAADYTLINQLPQRVAAAKAASQKDLDSGTTARMVNATYTYNNALAAMIKELGVGYYAGDAFTAEDVDEYLKALYVVGHFRQDAGNPSGESQGTISQLDVPSEVSTELETRIAEMVEAIAGEEDAKFNYAAWKKKWEKAIEP